MIQRPWAEPYAFPKKERPRQRRETLQGVGTTGVPKPANTGTKDSWLDGSKILKASHLQSPSRLERRHTGRKKNMSRADSTSSSVPWYIQPAQPGLRRHRPTGHACPVNFYLTFTMSLR